MGRVVARRGTEQKANRRGRKERRRNKPMIVEEAYAASGSHEILPILVHRWTAEPKPSEGLGVWGMPPEP